MKETICIAAGVIGGFIAALFGGWNQAMTTLIIFMAIDYLTGFLVAAVFHRSGKTETGALSSDVGLRGIAKKGVMLLIVLVAARLDLLIGTTFIRDTACIALILNELISIMENAGLMGVPFPTVFQRAIDILQRRAEEPAEREDKP